MAKAITNGFLGMEVEELDDDVKDAIGEIANMVAGNLKNAYAAIVKVHKGHRTQSGQAKFNLLG